MKRDLLLRSLIVWSFFSVYSFIVLNHLSRKSLIIKDTIVTIMVSVETYIKTFRRVMPKRMKKIEDLLDKKKKIETLIKDYQYISEDQQKKLFTNHRA